MIHGHLFFKGIFADWCLLSNCYTCSHLRTFESRIRKNQYRQTCWARDIVAFVNQDCFFKFGPRRALDSHQILHRLSGADPTRGPQSRAPSEPPFVLSLALSRAFRSRSDFICILCAFGVFSIWMLSSLVRRLPTSSESSLIPVCSKTFSALEISLPTNSVISFCLRQQLFLTLLRMTSALATALATVVEVFTAKRRSSRLRWTNLPACTVLSASLSRRWRMELLDFFGRRCLPRRAAGWCNFFVSKKSLSSSLQLHCFTLSTARLSLSLHFALSSIVELDFFTLLQDFAAKRFALCFGG
ncbi:hypothetical protein HDK90DRAFT_542800 [Phyllosticta capitalensis]|uniref:Uncharacterized protein n=1 Tax=Phyllosticta capitalensis TaxID=121624 RepID=A0ABR1YDF2_9PEZI